MTKLLDDYRSIQPMVYKILKNIVSHGAVSHAYLIDDKHSQIGHDFVLTFAKYLLCPNQYSNANSCNGCTQCDRIEHNNFTEIKVIEPEGLWIKKEQLDALQEDFSKKAVEGEKRVYIIHQVDKLNKSAANSLLKFLEEPEMNIIAILTTSNVYQVMDTIISRCQIVTLGYDKNLHVNDQLDLGEKIQTVIHQEIYDLTLEEEKKGFEAHIDNVIKFLLFYEKNGKETILYTQKLWHSVFSSKEESLLSFDIMVLFYKDLLNCKCHKEILFFKEDIESCCSVLASNTIEIIIHKINVILRQKKKIYFNVNNLLLIDKLIIDLEEA